MSVVTKNKNDLPRGWYWSTLGDVCEKPQYGWTTKAVGEGNLRLLRTTDITKGQINWGAVPFCSDEPTDKEKYRLYDGDIVVSRAGSVGVSYLLVNPEPSVFASYLIRFKPLIDRKYVYYFLQSPAYWDSISEKSAGIAVQNVNASKLKDIIIPVSSPEQQKLIVAKIEELFSHIDAGIESLKKAKKLLKQYRQSVLKAAITGELTKEWREKNKDKLEPASQLLERILKERRKKWEEQQLAQFKAKGKIPKDDKWKRKYNEPDVIEPIELGVLPQGWVVIKLEGLCSKIGDVDHKMPKAQEQGVPYISTKDFTENNGINFDNTKLIKQEDYDHLCRKIFPEYGDVLLSRYGTVGEVRRVEIKENFQASYSIAIVKPASDEIGRYIHFVLTTEPLQRQIKKHTRSTAQPDLGLAHIREFEVPLPSKEEQKEIMSIVEVKFEAVARVEKEIDNQLTKAEKNKQSILASAFNGRLS